jgi:hypothetical protein
MTPLPAAEQSVDARKSIPKTAISRLIGFLQKAIEIFTPRVCCASADEFLSCKILGFLLLN